MKEQKIRLYVVSGIPIDTKFEPQTRKEISVRWYTVNADERKLTGSRWMIYPHTRTVS